MGLLFIDLKNIITLTGIRPGANIVTLGRQSIYLNSSDLRALIKIDNRVRKWSETYRWGDYCERFFCEVIGAAAVDSIDLSTYENATIVHDLGEPLPIELLYKFDLAIDGGTLEHVFNFPIAIKNLMQLVNIGGVAYLAGPCNNLSGHGFYQFSPELMFRVFNRDNGFEPITVRVARANKRCTELQMAKFVEYEVCDPDKAKDRVNLLSRTPVQLLAMARRVTDIEPFRARVLQSDYPLLWENNREGSHRMLKEFVRNHAPASIVSALRRQLHIRRASFRYKKHYRRV